MPGPSLPRAGRAAIAGDGAPAALLARENNPCYPMIHCVRPTIPGPNRKRHTGRAPDDEDITVAQIGAAERPRVPDRVVDSLVRKIVTGEIAPGERLPAVRELAVQMGVDRTSLRIALERLRAMNLLSVVQGSGVVVKDFRAHAGLSILNAVFSQDDMPDDPALLLQVLEFQLSIVPSLLSIAASRATPESLRELDDIYNRILREADDHELVVHLAVQTEDIIARTAGNAVVTLLYNSTRPARRRLMRRLLETVDVRAHFAAHQSLVREFMAGALKPDEVSARYLEFQASFTATVRARIVASLWNDAQAS